MIINLSKNLIKAFGLFLLGLFLSVSLLANKVSPSVIVASIEGEVSSLNMDDDFKVQMDASSVGKKINPKTLLNTGKTGKIALLFSNGTLITIKPGSRFYLRTYKQLEGFVEGGSDPGKLEEEPTQSELSGHLDYGDLVVKAPKLKKGSSMKLTSPLGVAGIRGTMFQLMAVRNSVTGDIMGGVNLISGDIDFTDTGGNMVTLLSGQSIQLATSKLGAPVASMTGELVDLSSTYGPALTEGFSPPPPEAIFPSLSDSSESDEDSEDSESGDDSFDQSSGNVASAGGNFDFIHQMASEIFFEIEEAESSSSDFSFESMTMAPTVDIPTPEVQAPAAPASVTGETETGEAALVLIYPPPQIAFNGIPATENLLIADGDLLTVELQAESEKGGKDWKQIDPGIVGESFTGVPLEVIEQWSSGLEPKVQISDLSESQKRKLEEEGGSGSSIPLNTYTVAYSVTDNSNLKTTRERTIKVQATRPTISFDPLPENIYFGDPNNNFDSWKNKVEVADASGKRLEEGNDGNGYYYFDPIPDLKPNYVDSENVQIDFKIYAVDWRDLVSVQEFSFVLKSTIEKPDLSVSDFQSLSERYDLNELEDDDPDGEFISWLKNAATASNSDGTDISNTIILKVNGKVIPSEDRSEFSNLGLIPGPNTLEFQVSDSRITDGNITSDLSEQLTETVEKEITVIQTPPQIVFEEEVYENPPETIQMADYDNDFGDQPNENGEFDRGWVSKIDVFDVRNQKLTFEPNPSEEKGIFYFTTKKDEFSRPDLFSHGIKTFYIVARDWRGVEAISDQKMIEVTIESPTIVGADDYIRLEVELSGEKLSTINPEINATDEFGNPIEFDNQEQGSITLAQVIGPNGETPETRIDELEEGVLYVLDYNVTDFREITSTVKRYLQVVVTPPTIENIEFVSEFEYGSAKDNSWTIEYLDPLEEFTDWLDGVEAKYFSVAKNALDVTQGSDFVKIISSEVDEGYSMPSEISQITNSPGTYDLNFTFVDPRYIPGVTHPDWKDNLTLPTELTFEIVATKPSISGPEALNFELSGNLLSELDPDINATGINGSGESVNISSNEVILISVTPGDYEVNARLDSLSQLPDQGTYTFTYEVSDERGVSSEVNRSVAISVTPPILSLDPFQSLENLHPSGVPHEEHSIEFKDPWGELATWLSSIHANDLFDNNLTSSITLQINGSDYTEFTSSAPDLAVGENELTFQVIDPRFIDGETNADWLDDLTTEISHSITVVVSPPSFDEINSTLDHVQEVDGRDWLAELDPWIGSIIAKDVRGVEIDRSGIQLVSSPDITVVGNYDLNYTITDWRGIESSISRSVQVIKTPPTLTITNGGWRNDLTFDENGTIEYMVKPVSAYLDFDNSADDGEFTILPTSSSIESRKVYVQALGYDGTNISDAITVGNIQINNLTDSVVDYSILGSTQLDISIDDSLFRNFDSNGNGAVVSLTPTVEIVDKLGPYIQVPDGLNPLSIVGISNQAFPVPRIDIIDNLDSQTAIENNLLEGSVFQYDSIDHTDYPDENLWIGSNVPGIAENEILMFSGYYKDYITFQAFEDLSGNEMRNSDVTLDVNITDSVVPIVTLRGGDPLYVDLNATISGTETFVDPGLQIVENLYVHELGETTLQLTDGSVIWDYADELVEKGMLVIEIQAFDENTSTYDAPLTGGETIENLLANYSAADGDASRYRLTYRFTDRAGNVGNEVTREIEFRNDPNDPSQVSFDSTVLVVDDVYEVEAESITSSDLVNAFIQLATGPQYTSIANKEFLYVAADGNSTVDWSPELVNYYKSESGDEFYVNDNRLSGGNLEFIPKDSEGLPKMVVRYSAYNEFGDLFQYSLEYRFKDTSAPNFDIITDSTIVGNIQTNIPYDDLGVQGFEDAYNDSKGQTHLSLYSKKLFKDDIEFFGPALSDPFSHLETEGFWTPGNYEVEYVVRDDFNNSRELRRSITVVDSIAPHMAMISHAFLNDTDTTLSSSFDQLSDNPSLPYDNTIFSSLDINPTTSGSYYSEQDEDFDFILKLSEANQSITTIIQTPNPSTSVVKDNYGRSYAWHSAFEITLSNNEKFKDPGVYVENLSDYNITVSSSIEAVYGDGGQLVEVKVTYSAQQETDVQTNSVIRQDISASRSYTFLDEELPSITFSETATSVTGPYIMLEAGNSWDDSDGNSYYIWDTNKSASTEVLTIRAWDAVDGEFPDSDIIKTITNISTGDSNTSISSASDFLDHIYEIKYEVTDTAGNTAEAFRYVRIKDTTAPTITWTFTDPYEVDNNDSESVAWVKDRILDALNFSATDASDTQLSVSGNREKWSVSIDPEPTIDPSNGNLSVYPYNQVGEGYDFNVTVTDDSGNSASIGPYELKIGDYTPPVIYLIGDTEIHEFLRYGENTTDFANQTENLFEDQSSSEDFPRTEFDGGAHRLMIANFSFADPGVWAEDQSFDPAVYPDLNNNDKGESYAIQRLDDEADFLNIDENNSATYTPGVIYSYSKLHTKSLKEYQNSFDVGFSGSDPGPTDPNATVIDSDNDGVHELINVHKVTIQYKVIDGWGNPKTSERFVYIYQSQQVSNSAFYATPLWDKEGDPFPDLYDTNRSNSIDGDPNPFISNLQKDYDGDGVSDYWENIFGSRPDDASHTPSNLGISLTDPGAYKTVLTQAPSIPE